MPNVVEPILRAPGAVLPASAGLQDRRSLRERLRIAGLSAVAVVLGVLPHVLHHAGPLAGAALFAGVGGSLLFGALGFLAAIPLLVRLQRRFDTWRAPAAALALFATLFAISTVVVGPAIAGNDDAAGSSGSQQVLPEQPSPTSTHDGHH